jgi:hypothetical protein
LIAELSSANALSGGFDTALGNLAEQGLELGKDLLG